jgi:hypothetical protein
VGLNCAFRITAEDLQQTDSTLALQLRQIDKILDAVKCRLEAIHSEKLKQADTLLDERLKQADASMGNLFKQLNVTPTEKVGQVNETFAKLLKQPDATRETLQKHYEVLSEFLKYICETSATTIQNMNANIKGKEEYICSTLAAQKLHIDAEYVYEIQHIEKEYELLRGRRQSIIHVTHLVDGMNTA